MPRSVAGFLVLLLAAACGTQLHSQSSSSARRGTPAVVATEQESACRLPIGISWSAPAVTPGSPPSGFLAYPGGSFTPDSSSNPAHSPYRGPNTWVVGLPYVPSYDRPARQWLPVPPALISPDGATYTFTEQIYPPALPSAASAPRFAAPTGTHIHIVDVASAADRVILNARSNWAAIGYSGESVYLIDAQAEAAPDSSLYALDVSTGAIQELEAPLAAGSPASPIEWTVIGSGAAWGTDLDGRLARLDFQTRRVSLWLSNSGTIRLIGLDEHGMPIVSGNPFGARLVTAPDQTVEIADATVSVDDVIADTHGIWVLSGGRNVYLWTSGAGLSLIGSAVVQADQIARLAGPCQ